MAWDNEMRVILRVLINDTDESAFTYSDERLDTLIVVAARYTIQDVDFSTDYIVDIVSPDISPDPTTTRNLSNLSFVNLTVLKAACLVDQSILRTKAAIAGIRAKCGPAVIETMRHMEGFKELLDSGPCASYETLKLEYAMGNLQPVEIILSPFTSNAFSSHALSSHSLHRH